MSNVLIIGASKGIGLETVKSALASGHQVRAFARTADKISLSDLKSEKRSGDALNGADVQSALEGMDVVTQALGIPAGPQMVFGPVRVFSESTKILISAMENKGVRRLICVTGFGSGDSRDSIGCIQSIPFQMVFGRAYADKDVQERAIRTNRIEWTIVRPGVLTNGPRTGRYKVLNQAGEWRNGLISRADVAHFMVRQIDDEAYVGRTPVLVY